MSKPETNLKNANASETAKPKAASMLLVIDTTAIEGPRVHEMIVDGVAKPFTFERGKPLALPFAIAAKFLKHEAFKLVDEKGNLIAYKRRPKQPDELGAGEQLKLTDEQTVANFDELSNSALLARALEIPGGEQFAAADKPPRADMIAFLVTTAKAKKAANASKEKDVGEGEFIPEADLDEEAA